MTARRDEVKMRGQATNVVGDDAASCMRSGLWSFLSSWRQLFSRFDADASGGISRDEFSAALVAFGYRLSAEYVGQLFAAYDVRRRGTLSFDVFVQACIALRRMTDVFRRYDEDRDGYITLSL